MSASHAGNLPKSDAEGLSWLLRLVGLWLACAGFAGAMWLMIGLGCVL